MPRRTRQGLGVHRIVACAVRMCSPSGHPRRTLQPWAVLRMVERLMCIRCLTRVTSMRERPLSPTKVVSRGRALRKTRVVSWRRTTSCTSPRRGIRRGGLRAIGVSLRRAGARFPGLSHLHRGGVRRLGLTTPRTRRASSLSAWSSLGGGCWQRGQVGPGVFVITSMTWAATL